MIIVLRRHIGIVVVSLFLLIAGIFLGRYGIPAAQTVSNLVSTRRVPIYKVDTDEKKIAFSFDATWGTELTDQLLDILDEYGVKTTFFLAGNWIESHPDYVKLIAERGHEIGTHSYAHPHMNSMSRTEIIDDLEKNHELLKGITEEDPILFRPPFGEYNNQLIDIATEMGYYTIQWSIDSLDWQDVSAHFMIQRVLNNLQPGEIVLFHNAGKHTPEAVRTLLPELQARGYEVVPISELIYKENYIIEPHSGVQKRSTPPPLASSVPTAVIPEGAVFEVPEAHNMASFVVNVDWGEEQIPPMLALFEQYDAQVTFFITGRWAQRHEQLIKQMVHAGHEIANHGMSHAHPKQLTVQQLTDHIIENQQLLNEITGQRAAPLYAPPYGEWDARIVQHALQLGFHTVLWTADTIDWQDPTSETIVQRIVPKLQSGTIVLMHPRANTVAALPQLLQAANNAGLSLVPVGELIAQKQAHEPIL